MSVPADDIDYGTNRVRPVWRWRFGPTRINRDVTYHDYVMVSVGGFRLLSAHSFSYDGRKIISMSLLGLTLEIFLGD